MVIQKEEHQIKNFRHIRKADTNNACKLYNQIFSNLDDNVFIKVFSKSTNKHYCYNAKAIKDNNKLFQLLKSFGYKDVYISLNQFNTMHSNKKRDVFCITTIAVDIDFRKIKIFEYLTTDQVIELLKLDEFEVTIPTPNFIEKSNQLRLLYNINPCYVPKLVKNIIRLADKISSGFAERLKDYGAEKQGVESFMRVVGSINSKNNSTVEIIDNNIEPYNLEDIQELWLDELPKDYKTKIKKAKRNKVYNLHNINTLNLRRLRDLQKIQADVNSYYNLDYRKRLCYLYRNFKLIQLEQFRKDKELEIEDLEIALDEMLEFNSNFYRPLLEKHIISATNNLDRKLYYYKNDTLMELLELDYKDVKRLGLESFSNLNRDYKEYYEENKEEILKQRKKYYKENKDVIKGKAKEKYQENKNVILKNSKKKYEEKLKEKGETSKADKVAERRQKIKDLLDKGLSEKAILETLDISKRTYIKDRNNLKEQGLI